MVGQSPTVSSDFCRRQVFSSGRMGYWSDFCQTFKDLPSVFWLGPNHFLEGKALWKILFVSKIIGIPQKWNAPFWSVEKGNIFSDDRIIPEKFPFLFTSKRIWLQNLRDSVRICKKKRTKWKIVTRTNVPERSRPGAVRSKFRWFTETCNSF